MSASEHFVSYWETIRTYGFIQVNFISRSRWQKLIVSISCVPLFNQDLIPLLRRLKDVYILIECVVKWYITGTFVFPLEWLIQKLYIDQFRETNLILLLQDSLRRFWWEGKASLMIIILTKSLISGCVEKLRPSFPRLLAVLAMLCYKALIIFLFVECRINSYMFVLKNLSLKRRKASDWLSGAHFTIQNGASFYSVRVGQIAFCNGQNSLRLSSLEVHLLVSEKCGGCWVVVIVGPSG
jgi:hypothetical protein